MIVVGASGFSLPFTPESADGFHYQGMYGVGTGAADVAREVEDIRALAAHPERLAGLGEFGRRFVVEHFSVEAVSARLSAFLGAAVANPRRFHVAAADGLFTAAVWVKQRQFLPYSWRFRMRDIAGQVRSMVARAAR